MKRVKRPHGLLPKIPERGSPITVVVHEDVVQARVRNAPGGRRIRWRAVDRRRGGGDVRRRDEGTTWVRGWDTSAARALAVAVALS